MSTSDFKCVKWKGGTLDSLGLQKTDRVTGIIPDGWINKEVIYTYFNGDGGIDGEVVILHYPDGTSLSGIIYSEKVEGAVEMPTQDISAQFEEKVKLLQNG